MLYFLSCMCYEGNLLVLKTFRQISKSFRENSLVILRDSAFHFAGAPASPGSAIRKSGCIKPRPRTMKRRTAYRQSFSFRVASGKKGAKDRSIEKVGRGCCRRVLADLKGSEIRVKSCTFVNSYESLPFRSATFCSRRIYMG